MPRPLHSDFRPYFEMVSLTGKDLYIIAIIIYEFILHFLTYNDQKRITMLKCTKYKI